MRLIIGCEWSGIVRDAFRARGHDAVSVDLLPSARPGPHIQGDMRRLSRRIFARADGVIVFPPCTYLCVSGLHWNTRRPERAAQTESALDFVRWLLDLPVARLALENPIGCISTRIRKPDQIIQPWMFGEDASKATCLWLKGFPPLVPTRIIRKHRYANQTASGQNRLPPSATRALERGRTYQGIADAMAAQWGIA